MSRMRILTSIFVVAAAIANASDAARSPLRDVEPGSADANAILEAQIAWMVEGQSGGQRTITLEPLVLKRNDRYAYLVASVTGSPPWGPATTSPWFLDAVLELKDGHWVSHGYQGPIDDVSFKMEYLCGYGAGLSKDIFNECGNDYAP